WGLRRSRLKAAGLEDRHVTVGVDLDITSEQLQHLDNHFTLLVLLRDDLLASIESLRDERRKCLDSGLQRRQIHRQIRKVRVAGHGGLNIGRVRHKVRVRYIRETVNRFDLFWFQHRSLPPFLFDLGPVFWAHTVNNARERTVDKTGSEFGG